MESARVAGREWKSRRNSENRDTVPRIHPVKLKKTVGIRDSLCQLRQGFEILIIHGTKSYADEKNFTCQLFVKINMRNTKKS